jgi:hypothetical protein
MIRDLCLQQNLVCIHAITPEGGGGKSIFNIVNIDIYERFIFNIKDRKGIATSTYRNSVGYQNKFGTQGIVIYDGLVNNVNSTDAGSIFNDSTGKWETTEGYNTPEINQIIMEINKSGKNYVELNVYKYKICGFFLDFTQENWMILSIRSYKEFFNKTISYNLPYYALTELGIVKINQNNIISENWYKIPEGTLIDITEIYSIDAINI